jgi:hypothetical protein
MHFTHDGISDLTIFDFDGNAASEGLLFDAFLSLGREEIEGSSLRAKRSNPEQHVRLRIASARCAWQ